MNKVSLSFQMKQLTAFVASEKLKFWKLCIQHHEFDSFFILKDLSDTLFYINKCDSLMLYKMYETWNICINHLKINNARYKIICKIHLKCKIDQ